LPGLPDPPRFPAAWRVGLDVARPVAEILVGAGMRLKADAWRRLVEERDSSTLGSEVSRMSPELLSLAAEKSRASCSPGVSSEPWTPPWQSFAR